MWAPRLAVRGPALEQTNCAQRRANHDAAPAPAEAGVHNTLLQASEGDIYLLGNGGSQANAHHISGDFIKTFSMVGLKLKFSCLADNVCHLTAAANDLSFEDNQ